MTCSVLILTKNEASNIAACIASAAALSDDIIVFDSFSTDDTVAIATKAGVRVIQHKFESYGAQREAARVTVDYRHEWVLALDADERVDADLAVELPEALRAVEAEVAAFRVRRKDFFRGAWIRRSTLYPSWHVRIYRHAKVCYPPRSVHEYPMIDGRVEPLSGHLLHDNFSKGLAQWWERHVRYAELEAQEMLRSGHRLPTGKALLSSDPVERRRALKALSYSLPLRPELRFLYMMLVRGAILDGPRGWEYCRMIAEYQRITDSIYAELGDKQASEWDHPSASNR